jgi:hypothetical protein
LISLSVRLPRAVLLGASVAIVVASVAIVAAACTRSGHRSSPPAASAQASPTALPLTSPSASALARQLVAGTEASLRSAVAIPSGQQIDPAAVKQFAALGSITFDLATFHYLDPRTATVVGQVARPPAGTSGTWTFTLVYVSSVWKLVDGKPDQ